MNTELTTRIIAAYVARNGLAVSDLDPLIRSVHAALAKAEQHGAEPSSKRAAAATIRRSIGPNGLVSFIDGRTYKTLRRHLGAHGFTPESYRARFGLPADYPLTAPDYSRRRSEFAKAAGLGTSRRRGAQDAAPSAV